MDKFTVNHILKLNKAFYESNAADFSAARNRSWPGWTRVAEVLREKFGDKPFSVLDVGSGNGRFYKFLIDSKLKLSGYLGIDASKKLNAEAKRLYPKAKFKYLDFIKNNISKVDFSPDLIVGNGIMHHIPGADQRFAWLKHLFKFVKPKSVCVLTFWTDRSMIDKSVAWPKNLMPEKNDYLLTWAGNSQLLRYVHLFDSNETSKIVALANIARMALLARYFADGKDNRANEYLIFEKLS